MSTELQNAQNFQQNVPQPKTDFRAVSSIPSQVFTEQLLWDKLNEVHRSTQSLSDKDAPDAGRHFIDRLAKTNCVIKIDSELDECDRESKKKLMAEYVAYVIGGKGDSFVNRIGLPPSKVEDTNASFANSYRHEAIHAISTDAAEVLKRSPFRGDTKIILHPLSFVAAMVLSEDVAYTGQAFLNHLDAKADSSIRTMTRVDLVPVEELEQKRVATHSLQDALTGCALEALSKFKKGNFTFRDHYHGHALENFDRAMNWRRNEGETGHVFVKAEPSDYYAIGAVGFMPNPLGKDQLDNRFLDSLILRPEHKATLDAICRRYNIPPLEDCPTLAEATLSKLQTCFVTANIPPKPPLEIPAYQIAAMSTNNNGQTLQLA